MNSTISGSFSSTLSSHSCRVSPSTVLLLLKNVLQLTNVAGVLITTVYNLCFSRNNSLSLLVLLSLIEFTEVQCYTLWELHIMLGLCSFMLNMINVLNRETCSFTALKKHTQLLLRILWKSCWLRRLWPTEEGLLFNIISVITVVYPVLHRQCSSWWKPRKLFENNPW